MSETEWLAKRFEENREHLRSVAFRMLGSAAEAEDAVQEAWLRLGRTDAAAVDNLGGWLTTVIARICLDMLGARRTRREDALPAATALPPAASAPETELAVADSVGPALLVVLETLAPAERVAFVLHDLFDLPFDEIAAVVGRTPEAARQLASRARRRVRGASEPPADAARRRELVHAFLAASREGNFDALLRLLSPEVALHADATAIRVAAANRWGPSTGLDAETRGAPAIAELFKGRAQGAAAALIDGTPGAVWIAGGKLRGAFLFTVDGGAITRIDIVMDAARLAALDVET